MQSYDLDNINQIDMECTSFDDESFNNIKTDDREVQTKTGIIINFNDDDDFEVGKTISANIGDEFPSITVKSNSNSDSTIDDYDAYNGIDMETKYSEDDDEEFIDTASDNDPNPIFYDNNPKGLISDEMLQEDKKMTSFGKVEDDYWKKLSKKHKNTNKKGAYNTSFHLSGNPELEKDMFNTMMGTKASSVDVHIPSDSLLATSSASGSADSGSSMGDAGVSASGSCCEELSKSSYNSTLKSLFDLIGFEVFKNSDNTYTAIDTCDIVDEITAKSIPELIEALRQYIIDSVIYPLQITANQSFINYTDWVAWYTDEMKDNYPNCEDEINYCDLIANHLMECDIED